MPGGARLVALAENNRAVSLLNMLGSVICMWLSLNAIEQSPWQVSGSPNFNLALAKGNCDALVNAGVNFMWLSLNAIEQSPPADVWKSEL